MGGRGGGRLGVMCYASNEDLSQQCTRKIYPPSWSGCSCPLSKVARLPAFYDNLLHSPTCFCQSPPLKGTALQIFSNCVLITIFLKGFFQNYMECTELTKNVKIYSLWSSNVCLCARRLLSPWRPDHFDQSVSVRWRRSTRYRRRPLWCFISKAWIMILW